MNRSNLEGRFSQQFHHNTFHIQSVNNDPREEVEDDHDLLMETLPLFPVQCQSGNVKSEQENCSWNDNDYCLPDNISYSENYSVIRDPLDLCLSSCLNKKNHNSIMWDFFGGH